LDTGTAVLADFSMLRQQARLKSFGSYTGFSSYDSEGGSYGNSNAIGPEEGIRSEKAEFRVAPF
jgi:hypothetical protein